MAIPEPPPGRFLIAFDDPTLEWSPDWTRIDDPVLYPNLVTSYSIDRGRQYEMDRTDTGRATVSIADVHGILDPTNPDGPFATKLEPLLQAMIGRWNPTTGIWHTRFRGFIEDFNYGFDPSQKVNRLELSLVDLFEILSAIEMHDDTFSDPTPGARPEATLGQVFFEDKNMDDRINDVLDRAGLGVDWRVIFTGNVHLWEAVYSPGESPMTAIQEAVDAELPTVGNAYCDRRGRFVVHGRLSKFDPSSVSTGVPPEIWDYEEWQIGDGAAVLEDLGAVAQLREFAFNRGLAKVLNSAYATPTRAAMGTPLTAAEIRGQLVKHDDSIGKYGIRSWSAQDLLTKTGLLGDPFTDDLAETKLFAQYVIDNYALPQNRITACGLRSIQPGSPGANYTWDLLSRIDVADSANVFVGSPGGGGFDGNLPEGRFFVEGVHEEVRPLGVEYDDVTMRLDLSPRAYFLLNPFPA